MSKYTLNSPEEWYQPGSNDSVLLNKLNIINQHEMEELETGLLLALYEQLFMGTQPPVVHNFKVISKWHFQWFENVYEWAGRLRNTNLLKDGFQFAAAERIPTLISSFEKMYLLNFDKIHSLTRPDLVRYLAESHVEFILIHPFREGNGRVSRLLFDTQSVQAGMGLLDYSLWDEHKAFYFKAIQAGVTGNYNPMIHLVNNTLSN